MSGHTHGIGRRASRGGRLLAGALGVGAALAFAACSEHRSPTETTSYVEPPRQSPDSVQSPQAADIPARVDALVTARLAPVVLPDDPMSESPDAVHPDIACRPEPWSNARCWFLYTPYQFSNPQWENPTFVYAVNDTAWRAPADLANPIVPYPGTIGYNSDPDQAFDPMTGRLVQMYRLVANGMNKIMIMATNDAHGWTTARLAFQEPAHDAVSPAMVIAGDGVARVWYVRSGEGGCHSPATSVAMRVAARAAGQPLSQSSWSAPLPTNLSIRGATAWHLDVAQLPGNGGYLALIAAYPQGTTCAHSDLWLAGSVDGLHWDTYDMPVFWRGMSTARVRSISTWYRGTMRYDAATDSLDLWPSALVQTRWTIFHTRVKLSDLLPLISKGRPTDFRLTGARIPQAVPTIEMP